MNKKCDLCGKMGKIDKFSKTELKKVTIKPPIRFLRQQAERIVGDWLHKDFEQLNIQNRKVRLCKDCINKYGVKK